MRVRAYGGRAARPLANASTCSRSRLRAKPVHKTDPEGLRGRDPLPEATSSKAFPSVSFFRRIAMTMAGTKPRWTSGYPNSASSVARIRSQAVARPQPPARALPWTAATMGRDDVASGEAAPKAPGIGQAGLIPDLATPLQLRQISSGTEIGPLPSKDDHPESSDSSALEESLGESLYQGSVQGIPLLGPVQPEGEDPLLLLDPSTDVLVHLTPSPAGSGKAGRRRGIVGKVEGAQVGAGISARRPEKERQGISDFLRKDHFIHEPPGSGKPGVQLSFVVLPHLVHSGSQVLVREPSPRLLQAIHWALNRAMTALSPSITPIRPVGRERMKSGSNPCPAMA